MPETSTTEQIVQACVEMKVGDLKVFTLDHDPLAGVEMKKLSYAIDAARKGKVGACAINRSGRNITISCYS